ncbi:hypothetical protein [Aeoliella sp. SH292]|uniref:hypothetical protein n=1 Tax=Aeoliella sp. SH292 TaxID=3454464 RepID=UPI003F966549
MKRILTSILLSAVAWGTAYTFSASQAFVVADGSIWDGVNNPYPAFASLDLSTNTYTFSEEMFIPGGATIHLNDPANAWDSPGNTPSPSITFDFSAASGGIVFGGASGAIDIHPGTRQVPNPSTFTLVMGATNIQGGGRIINGAFVNGGQTGDPGQVVITSQANIDLSVIDLSKRDAASGSLEIEAHGSINIGAISTIDVDTGGASGGPVLIRGNDVTVGDISTYSARTNSDPTNGPISITGLGAPSFDPNDPGSNSAASNIVTLTGLVNTDGPAPDGTDGGLTVTAVKVVLASGFSTMLNETGTSTFNVGELIPGFVESDLFMDMSSGGNQASFNVAHSQIPEPGTLAMVILAGLAYGGLRSRYAR